MTVDGFGASSAPSVTPAIVWSVAGNDSGGGAGLAADQRAAAGLGVHLCPVVAALTAQNSRIVTRVDPVAPELLDAQLAALAEDLPPVAIKTGLLGSVDNVAVVARWVDRLRATWPLALVVDPVLGASSGAAFADAAVLDAYRELLLPRATLVTPNEGEARRLVGTGAEALRAPQLGQALRAFGAAAVAITGGDSAHAPGLALDWIDTAHARGWLLLPRIDSPHTHGTGCTLASSATSALALGFVAGDALVLAKMATAHAIAHGHAAGQGAGPVGPRADFATQPERLPLLSWDESLDCERWSRLLHGPCAGEGPADIGLYAIVDRIERVSLVLAGGVKTVQLRIKTPPRPDAAWHAGLRVAVQQALAACRQADATLVVNDHWRLAAELAAGDVRHLAVHLGQEDLLALDAAGRAELAASGLRLGVSSHSLWELCRARGLAPWYVACGPVWPTLTKAMPWQPQGLDNLAWWVHMAGLPVLAIGGILEHAQAERAARSGAAGVCVVRGLGDDPAASAPAWQAAIERGRTLSRLPVPSLPHPSL
ncbi:MAG TPA: bifunctional hydroxymethylpyrimidine kinase/phosphomethylpyrimidine kinase [Ottowia sp.]|uniref:bifunctional hydroxymethylpyrimidine kinase/phosphomethylpyrimidine kinase n=1 Tax=Ottowia sp. TaxID=1898956 RepID=UPI002C90DFE4|nr:bifunctional hydroxymethylpyrimidine kinase/phosphomethylpyrimidine kinase [Ottowia sp.]HMN20733.1 bifunctional hydroxymethylpyrimidine kinase/phosphomethylpyrimidine kinase [Ottowia sp.]